MRLPHNQRQISVAAPTVDVRLNRKRLRPCFIGGRESPVVELVPNRNRQHRHHALFAKLVDDLSGSRFVQTVISVMLRNGFFYRIPTGNACHPGRLVCFQLAMLHRIGGTMPVHGNILHRFHSFVPPFSP